MVLIELQPSEILFSQKSIKHRFQDKNNQPGQHIGEVLDDIVQGRVKIQSIPKIEVINEDGLWISGDNRRLWIFKQLEHLGQVDKITVKHVKRINTKKLTGISHSIAIRGGQTFPSNVWFPNACCTDCQKEKHSHEIQDPSIQSVREKLRKRCRKGDKSKTAQEEEQMEVTSVQELADFTGDNIFKERESTGNTGTGSVVSKAKRKRKRRGGRKRKRTSKDGGDDEECTEVMPVVATLNCNMTLRSGKILSYI